jgi:hypothetical protein
MDSMSAIREYASQYANLIVAPLNNENLEFLAASVPSHSATTVFSFLKDNPNYTNYSYKEPALNSANLKDEADSVEALIIQGNRSNSALNVKTGERQTPVVAVHRSGRHQWNLDPPLPPRPAPSIAPVTPPEAPTMVVKQFRFTGNTVFPAAELAERLASFLDRPVSFWIWRDFPPVGSPIPTAQGSLRRWRGNQPITPPIATGMGQDVRILDLRSRAWVGRPITLDAGWASALAVLPDQGLVIGAANGQLRWIQPRSIVAAACQELAPGVTRPRTAGQDAPVADVSRLVRRACEHPGVTPHPPK